MSYSLPSFDIPSQTRPDGSLVIGSASDNCVAEFYTRAKLSPSESEKQGRPVYRNVDHVRIFFPGERDVVDKEATDEYKRRWPRQWQAYQEQREQTPEGTLLSCLFPQSPDIVANLKALKFHTVEQLANANDHALQNVGMGAREWQRKAKAYLEAAKDGAVFHRMEAELKTRDEKIALQDQALAAMQAEIARLTAAQGAPAAPPAPAADLQAMVAAAVAQALVAVPRPQETPAPPRRRGRPPKEA